jgi:NADH-quinone oxidoreductase subunit L
MYNVFPVAWLIPVLPLLAFALIGLVIHRWPKLAAGLSIGAIGVAFILSVLVAVEVFSSYPGLIYEVSVRWLDMPGLKIDMGILIDPLTALMLIVVTTVALLVQIYSWGYMHGDPGFASYFSYQSIFAGSMLGLVIANNFGQIFVFWELVGMCSYLLIGFWFGQPSARDAAIKAFVTNRIGDFGFLLGILLLMIVFGTLNYGELTTKIAGYQNMDVLLPIAILLFFGPMGKSAQFPLHVWLPDAMEGPTPVSALIHAATMVAAGVYLIARAYFIFSNVPPAMLFIGAVGGFTALFAASIAVVQNDIKRILAYSTLSQLGYMVMAMGIGAMTAGMFHLMTHAFFKSLLFLAAGSVIHALSGEQNIWKMGNLSKKMPVTTWTFVIGALALAGIPPLAGFWSKDEILLGAYAGGFPALYILGSLVAFMTAFYMFRLIFVAFFGSNIKGQHAHESTLVMTLPLIILAVLSVGGGIVDTPFTGNVFGHYINAPGTVHYELNPMIMIVSTLLAIAGILLAWLIYQRQVIRAEDLKLRWSVLYNILDRKFYVDEFYAWLRKMVVDAVARWLEWLDLRLVNGAVNGLAYLTGWWGRSLRLAVNGQVQTYALWVVVGVAVLLLTALWTVFTVLS